MILKFRKIGQKVSALIIALLLGCTLFAQEKYELSEESTMKVTGTSTLHDWEVVSNKVSGGLLFEMKGKAKKNQPLKGSIIESNLSLKVESLKSERGETMNGKMHRALLYDEFPEIKFQMSEAISVNEDNTIARGILTIAGKAKSVEIEVTLKASEDIISVQGSKDVKLGDFEIDPPTAMFGQIETGNDIVISFDLTYLKE